MKEGVQKLILEYFNCNIFDEAYELSPGIKKNIEETFTFAYNHHQTKREINEQLAGSNISELRDRIRSNNNPFPVRLGIYKSKLKKEAFATEGTIHALIRNIIADYYDNKSGKAFVQKT